MAGRDYMDGLGVQAPGAAQQDVREIAVLIARFACNNHTICDEELRPIGKTCMLPLYHSAVL